MSTDFSALRHIQTFVPVGQIRSKGLGPGSSQKEKQSNKQPATKYKLLVKTNDIKSSPVSSKIGHTASGLGTLQQYPSCRPTFSVAKISPVEPVHVLSLNA